MLQSAGPDILDLDSIDLFSSTVSAFAVHAIVNPFFEDTIQRALACAVFIPGTCANERTMTSSSPEWGNAPRGGCLVHRRLPIRQPTRNRTAQPGKA
jgi:hypothetical protein